MFFEKEAEFEGTRKIAVVGVAWFFIDGLGFVQFPVGDGGLERCAKRLDEA